MEPPPLYSPGRRPLLQFPPPPPYPPPDCDSAALMIPGMPGAAAAPQAAHRLRPQLQQHHPAHVHVQHVQHEQHEQHPLALPHAHPFAPRIYQPQVIHHADCPYSYSYAYYEPGAASTPRHVMERQARHTYVTRYGTEENIYEEIGEVSAKRQAALEEEVRSVQSRHRRVLGELNLTVEAMLMPGPQPGERSEQHQPQQHQHHAYVPPAPDLLEDLLRNVGPTDELLSPAGCSLSLGPDQHDSGFSGSSAASAGSLRRPPPPPPPTPSPYQSPVAYAPLPVALPALHALHALQQHPPSSSASSPGAVSLPGSPSAAAAAVAAAVAAAAATGPHHQQMIGTSPASPACALHSVHRPVPRPVPAHRHHRSLDLGRDGKPHGHGYGHGEHSHPKAHGHGFWSKRAWRKIPGFHASSSKLNDEPRMRSGSWDDGRHQPAGRAASRTLSSEESWCSASASDRELSSDEESEKSSRSNGQLSSTLNKARTLCDKWRGSAAGTGIGSPAAGPAAGHAGCGPAPGPSPGSTGSTGSGPNPNPNPGAPPDPQPGLGQGRLLRWFSMRRGSNHYEVEGSGGGSAGTGAGSGTGPPGPPDRKMPLLAEVSEGELEQADSGDSTPLIPGARDAKVEEDSALGLAGLVLFPRRQLPPSLPPAPSNLTPQQLKRRYIVAAIVHSENSYVATLQRLVNDYKKPLEESQPPILSAAKIQTLFHRLPEILQCHTLFRIALAESVRAWDREERLGDVFVASFSKAIVLDIYSGFINNFSVAMELAKQEAKRKSALADFFKVKQISSHDRLSFFGLMVKPVQRFPQFILFLQDLLKHTPQGHHDRMSLQLALTQLESLAEMLNERKREAEQFQAFREMLRLVSGKFSARPLAASDGSRCLLREDNVQQLEFNAQGLISKTKSRRLLLLNDLLVCVAVSPSQRLTLKWSCPVADIEVVDNSTSPTLSRLLTAGQNKGGSLKSSGSGDSPASHAIHHTEKGADGLCAEMGDLMHDFEVVSRIQDLAAQLRGSYTELNVETTRALLSSIQAQIQQRDEEMAWLDSCCLQLRRKDDTLTFQMESPAAKQDWITELRLAQLALDANNSPAWEVPEQERRPSTKMPLFVKARPVVRSHHHTEVRCGCFYTVSASKASLRQMSRKGRARSSSYLWVCTSDGVSSHVAVMSVGSGREVGLRDAGLRDAGSLSLVEACVSTMEFVRGDASSSNARPDSVWMGTDSRRLLLYAALDPESPEELGSVTLAAGVTHIRAHCDSVFVALANGSLLVFRRATSSENGAVAGWAIQDPVTVPLGTDPVAYLLPINLCLYAACGNKVFVMSALTGEVQKSFSVAHGGGSVHLMAHSGIGLWISLLGSSTICLYHTETFKHLQDINIASNVVRVTTGAGCTSCVGCAGCSEGDCTNNNNRVHSNSTVVSGGSAGVSVTALLAGRGLLWVGTNVGIALTIPLPRLEGVPIISGRVNISYHAHFGPITFLLALQPRPTRTSRVQAQVEDESEENHLQESQPNEQHKDGEEIMQEPNDAEERKRKDAARLRHQLTSNSSPVVLRRRLSKQPATDVVNRRASKTLPRGLGMFSTSTTSSQGSGEACDVYGLYGELMYVKDYDGEETVTDPAYESLRRSDPELAAIPGKVSTLDRQLRLKASRPRSLDLSNWSVDSRTSSLYTSSGSEDSRPVSRQNSMAGENQTSSVVQPKSQSNGTVNPPPQSCNKTKTKPKDRSVEGPRRTVITLMGGRGYVNWRQSCCPSSNDRRRSSNVSNSNYNSSNREPNSSDAHLVVWEMKL